MGSQPIPRKLHFIKERTPKNALIRKCGCIDRLYSSQCILRGTAPQIEPTLYSSRQVDTYATKAFDFQEKRWVQQWRRLFGPRYRHSPQKCPTQDTHQGNPSLWAECLNPFAYWPTSPPLANLIPEPSKCSKYTSPRSWVSTKTWRKDGGTW